MDEKVLLFRKAALAAGIRTIAAEFNGSGDEGDVQTIGFPDGHEIDHTTPLAVIEEESDGVGVNGGHNFEWGSTQWVTDPRVDELKALAKAHDVSLDGLFYSVLQSFPGDWVNNEGGYGNVFLDLATGAFCIDGYQRVESVEAADASGTFFSQPLNVADPVVETADYIKNLLG